MADYNIKADITANTKGYEAGIKKAQESTKKFGTSLSKVIQGLGKNGLVGAMGSIGLASAGLTATLGAVVKIAKQVSQTIGECTEAYKQQLIAERQLETAISNNPLVTGSAKKRLTEFANEMQKVSNYGDEQLIPMMANLVSLGRTEEETMKIMAVAMDMSASGSMSLDTAITQLNATLNGNIGRLGQQNAELKALTKEELESGKAVEILGEKFKGLAQSTVDTSKQLKNIKGDFKEAIGEFTLPSSDMWNKFWTGFYEKGIDAINRINDAMDKGIIGKGIAGTLETELKKLTDSRERRLYTEDEIHLISDSQLKALRGYLESLKSLNKEQEVLLKVAQDETESRVYLSKLYEDMDREEAERQKTIEAQKEAEQEIIDLKDAYLKKIAEQEAKWKNIEAVTGETVKNEEKIKFYQDSLVDLMTQAQGKITTNNQLYKDQVKIIGQLQAGLDPEEKKTGNDWEKKLRQQLIARLEADKEEKLAEVENSKMASWQKEQVEVNYNEQIKALKLEALEIEKQEALESVKDLANAEEERLRIQEYYENEKFNLILEYAKKNKEAGKVASDSFVDGFKSVTKKLTPIMKEIGKVLSSIGNIAKSMFTGGVSIFSKIFNIDLDTVLDTILKIEDKVLTFFVETLPRLPQFVASVMQSISVLLQSVLQVITPEKITAIITDIMNTIIQYAPTIIGAIAEIIINLVNGITEAIPMMTKAMQAILDSIIEYSPAVIEAIANMLEGMLDGIIESLPKILDTLNVIVEKLAEVLPELIQKLIDLFIGILKEPQKIAQLVVTIIKGFVEIFNVLLRNIGPLLEALLPAIGTIIIELIKAIPDILASMAEALGEALKGIGKFIVNMLIDILNLMFDGISKAWTWIPGTEGIPHIPKLATGTDNAQKGLAIVGEAGPELVRFNGGEQVLSNRNTQKALAGIGNSGNTFNVTFNNTQDTTAYAMMSQLRQYNRQMAINGVI